MNTLLFSTSGIHYEDGGTGAITAIYVPSRSRQQIFADIPSPDNASVKERYGEVTDAPPLWRVEGPFVHVYGDIDEDIVERRSGVEVYLPQDYMDSECQGFYQVFGNRWIVFGSKEHGEDGKTHWGVSIIDCEEVGVVDFIVASISERMLTGSASNITVSVHENEAVMADLAEALEPFDLTAVPFSSLKIQSGQEPLYIHRDYGVLMLTVAMFSFILLVSSIIYCALTYVALGKVGDDVALLDNEIRKIQRNKKLGHIRNPKEILNFMQSSFVQPPSSALDAAARAASEFGQVTKLEMHEADIKRDHLGKPAGQVLVKINVAEDEGLLLDQEQIARAVIERSPWVRSIERPVRGGRVGMSLEIGVQVK